MFLDFQLLKKVRFHANELPKKFVASKLRIRLFSSHKTILLDRNFSNIPLQLTFKLLFGKFPVGAKFIQH